MLYTLCIIYRDEIDSDIWTKLVFIFGSSRVVETQLIRWQRKGSNRHPARTWMIRVGLVIIAISGAFLALGLVGVLRLSPEATCLLYTSDAADD